ncbi:uncharacterized protein C8R40DRAFT_1087734 [Lentinula edodes]|uniref:uncharacterized protein n=1 Tax=Lentinula edodes TaxID=5353 RepID=UPI001E8CC769|nr:uncharacterized protein C8R40DRAFT_1087734 [Lentinula edodes]KAH7878892.1 hypothetical protein C8R40DRAFT_1087734 [Lentinula edodes]
MFVLSLFSCILYFTILNFYLCTWVIPLDLSRYFLNVTAAGGVSAYSFYLLSDLSNRLPSPSCSKMYVYDFR